MSASAPWHRQVARRRGSEGRAHQIWPVIQTGATVMDRLVGHGGFRCVVTQLITHRAAAGGLGRPEPVSDEPDDRLATIQYQVPPHVASSGVAPVGTVPDRLASCSDREPDLSRRFGGLGASSGWG
jgi:hypothetical protein